MRIEHRGSDTDTHPDLLLNTCMVEKYRPPNAVAEHLVEAGVYIVDDDPSSTNMMGRKKAEELRMSVVGAVHEDVDVDVVVSS